MNNHNQQKPRGGFPCRRNRKRIPSHKKGVAYSNLLDRFKRDGKKIFILHATRGWKVYA